MNGQSIIRLQQYYVRWVQHILILVVLNNQMFQSQFPLDGLLSLFWIQPSLNKEDNKELYLGS